MGFTAMDQDKCVLKATPFLDQPPIYAWLYGDEFVYFSEADKVEEWFFNNLKSHMEVGFMEHVQWFLGQRYEWSSDNNGKLSCHISQQAFIKGIPQKHNLQQLFSAKLPYLSGFKIDRIQMDGMDAASKLKETQRYQSIAGCLNWLTINTRPDNNTAYSHLIESIQCEFIRGSLQGCKICSKILERYCLAQYLFGFIKAKIDCKNASPFQKSFKVMN